MSVRDITVGDTFDFKFTTRAFATGVPTTMTGTPTIEAYPGNSVTQITAGITLTFTSGFDGVAGLCNVRVVATGGNGFAADTDYALVIAGTAPLVDGVSVLGEVIGHFSTSRSAAAVELANATDGLTAIKADTAEIGTAGVGLSNIGTIATCTAVTNAVVLPTIPTDWITADGIAANAIGSVEIAASALDGKGDWNIGKTEYQLSATGVDDIWNEEMALHTTADTAGLLMNEWQDGGRLDLILDARMAEASINTTGGAVDTVTTATTATNLTNAPTNGDLTATMKASVNTEVDNALNVTTYAEPVQGIPTSTTTLVDKIGYLYKVLRNRKTSTATLISIYNDDGTTVDHKRTISDNGTTYDETEIVSGP